MAPGYTLYGQPTTLYSAMFFYSFDAILAASWRKAAAGWGMWRDCILVEAYGCGERNLGNVHIHMF